MPKKNIELLKRLRTRFLKMRHRKHFDMRVVAGRTDCGTAMCIAGHTLDLAGYRRKYLGDGAGDSGDFNWFTPGGRRVKSAMAAAQRLLGLTYEEAQSPYNVDVKRDGLFIRFDLTTPKQAAAEIEKLIEETTA